MIPNQDEHGIRYTMYRLDQIDSDLVDTLLYQKGKDLSYEDAVAGERARQQAAWEDECESLSAAAQEAGTDCVLDDFEPDLDGFEPCIDEPVIEGEHEGVHYRTTWLGGAQMLWVFKSPILGHFALCSPCVPGACDGGSPTPRADGFCGYAVPPTWLYVDPDAPKIDWYSLEESA